MFSAPVQSGKRIQYLDVLRGFAITGVLFAYVFWNLGTEPETTWTAFDKIINQAGLFLVDSKFYTTLACLFTVGFVLHMNKTEDKAGSLYTYRKRLLILLIIGVLHALLLRSGDVLVQYAMLGFFVTIFYKASSRTIMIAMVITFLLEVFLPLAWRWWGFSFPQRPSSAGELYWVENFARVKFLYSIAIFYWETTLLLLLTGLLVGKEFIQKKIELSNGQLSIVIVTGFVAGIISYVLINVYPDQLRGLPDIGNTFIIRSTVYHLLDLIHKIGIASFYAGILFLLCRKFRLTALSDLGKMSLTNYISQSLVLVPICLSFNLFDHITPAIALVIFVVLWILQILFSKWWLKHHQFGPMEGLLRRFTYGELTSANKESNQIEFIPETILIKK